MSTFGLALMHEFMKKDDAPLEAFLRLGMTFKGGKSNIGTPDVLLNEAD
jgi:hypothetical protein